MASKIDRAFMMSLAIRETEQYRRYLVGVLYAVDDYQARVTRTAIEASVARTERHIADSRAWLHGYRRRRDQGPWARREQR